MFEYYELQFDLDMNQNILRYFTLELKHSVIHYNVSGNKVSI